MSSFEQKKILKTLFKDGLIITATTAGIFFALKAANKKPPQAFLEAMDILELASEKCGGILVKDYAVYKKWINE